MNNYIDHNNEQSLDPQDWDAMRALGHRMIDDVMDYLQGIKDTKVWKPIPPSTKHVFDTEIPLEPSDINEVYNQFFEHILPYPAGNIHPRFWSWVQGTGTPFGVLADMLSSALNSNNTIGEHSAMYVEAQVINWCKSLMGYKESASGLLVSGGSMANITGLIVARNHITNTTIRKRGLKALDQQLTIYCSSETHTCVLKAGELLGIGSDYVRKIAVDAHYRIDTHALISHIKEDINAGYLPMAVIANAGTVNTGAIDDLATIRHICDEYKIWMHVDGAFGALAKLLPEYDDLTSAIALSDSVAFDLHKWMYMPYEVGCILICDQTIHRDAFSFNPTYLIKHERGLASGPESLNNYGIELSRGFKALKVWMSLKEHGLKKYQNAIRQNIAQAHYLAQIVSFRHNLELMADVSLNIVCFRYISPDGDDHFLNRLNKEILMELHVRGIAAPSFTILRGIYCIRCAIVNHRSTLQDFDALVQAVVDLGDELKHTLKQ